MKNKQLTNNNVNSLLEQLAMNSECIFFKGSPRVPDGKKNYGVSGPDKKQDKWDFIDA